MAGHDAAVTGSATDSLGSSPLVPASEETFVFCFFASATYCTINTSEQQEICC